MQKKMIFAIGVIMTVTLCGCAVAGNGAYYYPAAEANDTEPAAQPDAADKEDEEINDDAEPDETEITITDHPLSCKSEDDVVLAEGHYPEIILSEKIKEKYPKLSEALDDLNDQWSASVRKSVSEYSNYKAADYFTDSETPYSSEMTAKLLRFDANLFTVSLAYYDFTGGAHPVHSTGTLNIDPFTGKEILLKDVLADTENAPALIKEALYEQYPENVEEIESYAFFYDDSETMDDVFRKKFEENGFTWAVTDEGLRIYFSPYEIAPYAAGDIVVNLTYDKYADLVKPQYVLKEKQDLEKIVKTESADEVRVSPAALEGDEAETESETDKKSL